MNVGFALEGGWNRRVWARDSFHYLILYRSTTPGTQLNFLPHLPLSLTPSTSVWVFTWRTAHHTQPPFTKTLGRAYICAGHQI
jgi:hypothetical protein